MNIMNNRNLTMILNLLQICKNASYRFTTYNTLKAGLF